MKKQDNKKSPVSAGIVTNTTESPVITPESLPASSKFSISDSVLIKSFWGSLVFMLLLTWFTGWEVGYHQDEMDMLKNGKQNWAFYQTGGKDTSYLKTNTGFAPDTLLRYYGNGFEYLTVAANKITGNEGKRNEFNVRHVFNQLFGIIAILFAGLIARRLGGWVTAFFTIWLLYFSPSFIGHFYFNTKDVPFTAGYIATIYCMMKFLDELPAPSWKTTIGFMLAFAFTNSIRLGGLLLLAYFVLFYGLYLLTNRKLFNESLANYKSVLLKIFTVFGGGMLLTLLAWPYMLKNPIKHIQEGLDLAKKFPIKIPVNFEGVTIKSNELPANYIPKLMFLTTPVLILFLLIIGIILFFRKYKTKHWKGGILVIFCVIFPVIYTIATDVSLYNGWRHLLFIYPGMGIFAALGMSEIINNLKNKIFKSAFFAVCLLGISGPVIWSVKNHPYEYTYFNEIAGGFKSTFYVYDNDYWQITTIKAVDWLMKHENLQHTKDTVLIGSNAETVCENFIRTHYPGSKIKMVKSGLTGRNSLFWTYGVYSSLFIKPDYLENYFPPGPTIYSEKIDGIPITVILRDTARLDYKALSALKAAKHKLADSLYTAHIRLQHDDNPAILAYFSVVKGSINENDIAITYANKALQYHFSTVLDYNAYCGLGVAYANKGQYNLSVSNLKIAEKLLPEEHYSKDILAQVLQVMKTQNVPKK